MKYRTASFLIIILLVLINISCIYIPGCNLSREKPDMSDYLILRHNGKKAFMPRVLAPEWPVEKIFSVPVKNAVGTIDMNNAITVMRFTTEGIEYDIVAKNFLAEVNGAYMYGFCNIYSEEEIAYTQTRWAVVANIKKGKIISPVITYDLNDFITAIHSIDSANNKFVIERETPDKVGYKKILHVIKVVGKDNVQDEGSIFASPGQSGYSAPWQVHDDLIFTYDIESNKLSCLDSNLKPATHPFSEIFNSNSKNWRKVKEFIIHPTLPFGIVVEIGKDINLDEARKLPPSSYERSALVSSLARISEIHATYLLRWDTPDPEKQITPILTDSLSLIPPVSCEFHSGFQFSPDGTWMVFKDETNDSKKPVFVAIPVKKDAPLYFGEPLYLGRLFIEDAIPSMSAWTSDPLGFVVSSGEHGLWKWDLGNVNLARVVDTAEVIIPVE